MIIENKDKPIKKELLKDLPIITLQKNGLKKKMFVLFVNLN